MVYSKIDAQISNDMYWCSHKELAAYVAELLKCNVCKFQNLLYDDIATHTHTKHFLH